MNYQNVHNMLNEIDKTDVETSFNKIGHEITPTTMSLGNNLLPFQKKRKKSNYNTVKKHHKEKTSINLYRKINKINDNLKQIAIDLEDALCNSDDRIYVFNRICYVCEHLQKIWNIGKNKYIKRIYPCLPPIINIIQIELEKIRMDDINLSKEQINTLFNIFNDLQIHNIDDEFEENVIDSLEKASFDVFSEFQDLIP